MKIYVKESKTLSLQTASALFSNAVAVVPLSSPTETAAGDLILVSKADSITDEFENCHIIVFEELFEIISSQIYQEFYYRHEYYNLKCSLEYAKNSDVTTLISGSSYGVFGIDFSYINNAVNLSSTSQDLYYSIKLLKTACESNFDIKNVVICSAFYYFHSDLSLTKNINEIERVSKVFYPLLKDSHNCLSLPPIMNFNNIGEYINYDILLENFANSNYKKGFFDNEHPRNMFATKEWDDKQKTWQELSKEEQDYAAKSRAGTHNVSLKHHATYNENCALLSDFVDYCNMRSINVLIVAMPATNSYLKYLDPRFKISFNHALDSVGGLLHFLDLSDDPSFDSSKDFIDTDHLSESGAVKFTQILSSVLSEM